MNDRRSNKLTPLEEELLDLRDRVQELQDALRERDKAFAPEIRIPAEWGLTRAEAVTFSALMNAVGKTVRRAGLLLVCLPNYTVPSDEVLDKTVASLRKKVKPHGYTITSVMGVGYSITAPADPAADPQPATAAAAAPQPRKRPSGPNAYSEAEDAIIRAGVESGKLLPAIRFDLVSAGFRRSCTKSIRSRAEWLGLKAPVELKRWTAEEDEIVAANTDAPIKRVRTLLAAAGFRRTIKAVSSRRVDLGLPQRPMGLSPELKQIVRACIAQQMTDPATLAHLRGLGHDVSLSQVKNVGLKVRAKTRPGWTKERVDTLRAMAEEGKRPIDIATALGLTNSKTVNEKARQLGISFARLWLDEEVRTLLSMMGERKNSIEIGAALDRPPSQVVNKARRMGMSFERWPEESAWTDEKIDALRRASEDGVRLADAARAIGRPPDAVFQAARRFGISFSRDRKNLLPLARTEKTKINGNHYSVAQQ